MSKKNHKWGPRGTAERNICKTCGIRRKRISVDRWFRVIYYSRDEKDFSTIRPSCMSKAAAKRATTLALKKERIANIGSLNLNTEGNTRRQTRREATLQNNRERLNAENPELHVARETINLFSL